MIQFHIFWNDKNRDCSVNYIKDREDVFIYEQREVALGTVGSWHFADKILLQIGAEPLTSRDDRKDLILIDMGWKDALKLSKRFPQDIQRRSISGFKTAYPRTKKSSIRPDGGLRIIECMFVAKLIVTGIEDKGLLRNYHFREKFLEINRDNIEKYWNK